MKQVTILLLSVCLGLVVGCGPNPDTSKASPAPSPTETTTELEKAAADGTIDPATYGKGQ